MPNNQTLLAASNISVSRRGKVILNSVSMEINAGSIITLIGPNGAGKSTFIKVLLGIMKADNGDLVRSKHLQIGYMPQKLQIDDTLPITVERLLSLPVKVSEPETRWALQQTGVEYLYGQSVQSLSGGEFQRVMLARAILKKPNLLVLDEPVQGVDFTGEVELYELIEAIRDRLGCAVLMVSHDLHIVMAKTDKVICLNQHVCCSGEPETISDHPEFIQLFGDATRQNLAIYKHKHNHHHDLHEQGGHQLD